MGRFLLAVVCLMIGAGGAFVLLRTPVGAGILPPGPGAEPVEEAADRDFHRLLLSVDGAENVTIDEAGPIGSSSAYEVRRSGSDLRSVIVPFPSEAEELVLTRTIDDNTVFSDWASALNTAERVLEAESYSRNAQLQRLDEDYNPAQAWNLRDCVPVRYLSAIEVVEDGPLPKEEITLRCTEVERRF